MDETSRFLVELPLPFVSIHARFRLGGVKERIDRPDYSLEQVDRLGPALVVWRKGHAQSRPELM